MGGGGGGGGVLGGGVGGGHCTGFQQTVLTFFFNERCNTILNQSKL